MKKQARRYLPPAITFAAGVTAATLIFAPFNPATADTASHAAVSHVQVADQSVTAAKIASQNAARLKAANTPPAPSESQDVKYGNETGRIYYWQISSKKLWVDNTDTGWHSRYDVHVRRADGKVIFDENMSVYKLAWFVNHFKVNQKYIDQSGLMRELSDASATNEADARAAFKKSIGSLGEVKTTDGKVLKPYDPSQHPDKPYVPLNYDGI